MLLSCPECGREVSDTADACPNCGFKLTDGIKEQLRKDEVEAAAKSAAKVKKENRGCLMVMAGIGIVIFLLCSGLMCSNSGISRSRSEREGFEDFADEWVKEKYNEGYSQRELENAVKSAPTEYWNGQ